MSLFRDLPIRTKLLVALLTASGSVLLLAGVGVGVHEFQFFGRVVARDLSTQAAVLTPELAGALAVGDAAGARAILSHLQTQPEIVSAQVLTPEGKLFAEYKHLEDPASPPLAALPAGGREFDATQLLIERAIFLDDRTVGTFVARADLRERLRHLRSSTGIVAAVMLACLAIASVLAVFLQRMISDPILGLAQVAQAVSRHKDYSLRAAKRGNDEVGTLIDGFNEMLAQIQTRDEALQASEERFRQVTETIRGVFWMTDPRKEQMLYVSPAYEEIWGRTCKSLYASPRNWLDAVHPDDRERVLEGALTKQARGEYHEEYRILRPDGSCRWIQDRAFPVRDASGKVSRIVGIAEDITEHKRAEEVLRESEERFRTLFEAAPIGIALHSAGGKYLQTNRAYQQMLGYTDEELRALGVKKITHPEDIEKGKALYKELLDHKRDFYQREKRFWRKDGLPVWARSAAFAVRGTDGALRYVVSMVEDITERRRAKEKLRQLAAIVESASDAIIGRTLDNDIISWNPAAERMFGYTAEEAIGQPASILIPPARADEISQIMEQIKRGGRVEAFETIQVKKNGEPIAVSLTVSPIRDAAGEIVAFSAILRDITERKRLEKEVLEISAREQRRIGHDLHDGLGQYLAGTAFKAKVLEEVLAAESPGHTDAAKEIVKLINNAISQARALARGLSPIEVEASSLPSALEQLANETKKIFHVACLFKCNETNLSVASPAGLHLYRIAQEAVSNAVKHGKAREIEIELGLNGLQLLLVIRDKGKGFVSDSKRATGMGLNIMQYRANSIGGVLKIDSRRDHGTEIQCLVPTTLCSTPQPEFCYTNK